MRAADYPSRYLRRHLKRIFADDYNARAPRHLRVRPRDVARWWRRQYEERRQWARLARGWHERWTHEGRGSLAAAWSWAGEWVTSASR